MATDPTIDLNAVVAATTVSQVRYLESTASTNDAARELTGEHSQQLPLLIITDRQTSGRGQRGNNWWSGPGSLTFSIVIDGTAIEIPELIAGAAAVSVCEAIRASADHFQPNLKWPNDVYLRGRKAAGILIDSFPRGKRSLHTIGIGVNLNCRLSDAPIDLQKSATSLFDELKRPVNQESFLILLLNGLTQNLNRINESPDRLVRDYLARSMFDETTRLTVRSAAGEEMSGLFAGIGPRGQLLLKSGSEIHQFVSATIVNYD